MDKETHTSTITLSKERAASILVMFAIALLAVGLLAGLVKPSCTNGHHSTATGAPASQGSKKDNEEPWINHRLPSHLVPIHYDLFLYPDFYQPEGMPGLFNGNVSIWINVTGSRSSRHFLVHAKWLNIVKTVVRLCEQSNCRSSVPLAINRTFEFPLNEFWVIELETPVESGTVVIDLEFDGSLTRGLNGMYRSKYFDSQRNETKYLVSTKFQPTFARRAFPCLDEPQFKSTFTVTLVHRSNFTALSNMPPESNQILGDGLVATTFQKSVPMVTYLACFVVSDFGYKEYKTSNTTFRVYAAPDKVDQVDYALDVGVKVLQFFESFFNESYPLPKLDQIAIPDFSSGAMENWGLVTYREIYLLYNSSEASPANKQRLASVVAHELAHMWFGNLVTMKWWDDLWLNEGFASFVEYLGVTEVHPDWEMDSQFLVEDLQPVFTVDSVTSSHPIVVPVSHPDQISEVFDSISYNKGSSILRMIKNYLGTENFKKGLQDYMKIHKFNTTITDDLWTALSKAVNGETNVKMLMDTWTKQMGLPVVKLDVFGNQLRLKQERFLLDPSSDKSTPPSDFNYVWQIPITWKTSRNTAGNLLLRGKEAIVDLGFTFDDDVDWIKCNINETAYYRHNYMNANWKSLSRTLLTNPEKLTASDRAGLIDNAFNLARASEVGDEVPLELAGYLSRESHYTPWRSFENSIAYIRKMLITSVHYGHWQTYVRKLVSPVFRRVGLEETGSHLHKLMTSVVIHVACQNGDPLCLRNVSALFNGWLYQGKTISPSLRDAVYSYGMQKDGDEKAWNRIWLRYQNAKAPQEKNRLLNALAQTRVVWLINRLLAFTAEEGKIRDQDFFSLISFVANNPVGRPIVWNWARINWPRLVEKFTLNNRNLGRMIPGIVNVFNTPFQLNEVESFFRQYPDAGAGERGRKQVLETIRSNIAWMNKHAGTIADWLRKNQQVEPANDDQQ